MSLVLCPRQDLERVHQVRSNARWMLLEVLGDRRVGCFNLQVWFRLEEFRGKVLFNPLSELLRSSADIRARTVTRKLINNITHHSCRQRILHSWRKGPSGGENHTHANVTERLLHRLLDVLEESITHLARVA